MHFSPSFDLLVIGGPPEAVGSAHIIHALGGQRADSGVGIRRQLIHLRRVAQNGPGKVASVVLPEGRHSQRDTIPSPRKA
jgi:hypothetical protein